jgi:hypothetical protein
MLWVCFSQSEYVIHSVPYRSFKGCNNCDLLMNNIYIGQRKTKHGNVEGITNPFRSFSPPQVPHKLIELRPQVSVNERLYIQAQIRTPRVYCVPLNSISNTFYTCLARTVFSFGHQLIEKQVPSRWGLRLWGPLGKQNVVGPISNNKFKLLQLFCSRFL